MREGGGGRGRRGEGGQKKTPEPHGGSGNFVVTHLKSIDPPPLTLSGINYDRSLRISHRYSLPKRTVSSPGLFCSSLFPDDGAEELDYSFSKGARQRILQSDMALRVGEMLCRIILMIQFQK